MAKSYDYTVKMDLPEIGSVTVDATYHVGFSGSYWEPPDSDEVSIHKIVAESGVEVKVSDEYYESHYDLFLTVVGEAHSKVMDDYFNRYAQDYFDSEVPY